MPSLDCSAAAAFVGAIPRGRWASYKDVAAAAGNPKAAQSIGNWLRSSDGPVANDWRVITSSGEVAAGFVAHATGLPGDAVSARDLLRGEGIRFSVAGRAGAALRFRSEDWRS